jgi:hypothetical protein
MKEEYWDQKMMIGGATNDILGRVMRYRVREQCPNWKDGINILLWPVVGSP